MACGISKADFLADEAPRLEQWLHQNHHGQMGYMERNFDKRLDPRKLVPGAKSVVSLLFNYFPENTPSDSDAPKIARYAYGQDYHRVIKDKLFEFMHEIQTQIGDVGGRVFVDSAPVMEKAWAAKSGLGWVGKNTTNAFTAPYQLDASKCISYFTIELKDAIPQEVKGKFDQWAFGCDICQEVCPWNRFSTPHKEPAFNPNPELMGMAQNDWDEITEEVFNRLFEVSAVQRTGFSGLKRNLEFLK